ncbi:MAG: DUF4249 domain-containing protein, partial [Hymenobacteraceae bacterium]|nr:DUF4249 domain-containing protein [Hymenobacteraceae bacterium]MDX5511168.1 DUF4249 domain-containing protein [Hymenobacteraceae bacterium]
VVIFENDVVVDTLPYDSFKGYYQSKNYRPQVNSRYKLEVSAPGFPAAKAFCEIPAKVKIQKASIRDSAGIDEGGSYYSRLLVTFHDPADAKNYYNLAGKQVQTYNPTPWDPNAPVSYYFSPIYFFSELPTVSDAGDVGVLLKDDLFSGRSYDLALNYYPSYYGSGTPTDGDTLLIAFKTVSFDYYEYFRKLQLHFYNQGGDLFTGEPVVMPNNIQGGYGLFAGYSQDTIMAVK